jgi:hypothetical protein
LLAGRALQAPFAFAQGKQDKVKLGRYIGSAGCAERFSYFKLSIAARME